MAALHRARAEVGLIEATSGRPTCRFDGPDLDLVKRREGSLAAVADLQRALGHEPERVPSALADELLARWRGDRERRSGLDSSWAAYHDGGIEALGELADDLRRLAEGPVDA